MDLRNSTLHRLLESLEENNECLGWNMYRNKRGKIIVKISYDEETKLDLNSECDLSHQNVSFRRKTNKEIKRNHQRAQNFREISQPSKRLRQLSPEIPRQNLNNSSPIPNITDISNCEEEASGLESTTHDLSTSSQYLETEPVKPITLLKPSSPHRRESKNKLPAKLNSKDASGSDSDFKSKKTTVQVTKPDIRYCTYGWCEIAKVHTGCMCTHEVHPCTWCIDSKLVWSKMCSICKERD